MKLSAFDRRRKRDAYRVASRMPDYIIAVDKSNKHINVILSDAAGKHISCASTKSIGAGNKNIQGAKKISEMFCDKIKDLVQSDQKFAFNKNGMKFHGIVKTIAEEITNRGIKCS